jgi:TonB family protein
MNICRIRSRVVALLSVLIAAAVLAGCARTAIFKFSVDGHGNITSVDLAQSTGDPTLDSKAEVIARKNFGRQVAKLPSARRASTKEYFLPVRFE